MLCFEDWDWDIKCLPTPDKIPFPLKGIESTPANLAVFLGVAGAASVFFPTVA